MNEYIQRGAEWLDSGAEEKFGLQVIHSKEIAKGLLSASGALSRIEEFKGWVKELQEQVEQERRVITEMVETKLGDDVLANQVLALRKRVSEQQRLLQGGSENPWPLVDAAEEGERYALQRMEEFRERAEKAEKRVEELKKAVRYSLETAVIDPEHHMVVRSDGRKQSFKEWAEEILGAALTQAQQSDE